MRRPWIGVFFVCCIFASPSFAATPGFTITKASEAQPVGLSVDAKMTPRPAFEGPPVIVAGRPEFTFITTGFSYICKSDGGLLAAAFVASAQNCTLFSGPARMNPTNGALLQSGTEGRDWRLSYDGVMGGAVIVRAGQSPLLLTVAHGENKNEHIGAAYSQGTVNRDVDVHSCASGPVGGGYQDCWPSYNGFINYMQAVLEPGRLPAATDAEDRGPLVWPSMGYIEPGTHKKLSSGLRHPGVIVWNNFLYVFYVDTSRGKEPGRQGGLEVARAALAVLPAPLKAIPYFDGSFSSREPSLPADFETSGVEQFFERKGGRASGLWPGSDAAIKFSVAHLRNTSFFLGAEEFLNGQAWRIQLRISSDLVHWSDPIVVPGEEIQTGWNGGAMHYPVFADVAGKSASEIEASDFILLGTDAHGTVWRKALSVTLRP